MQSLVPGAPSSTTYPRRQPYLLGPERRCGISDMELAAAMLSHAVAYLIEEQRAGRRLPLQANREAIRLLCQAGDAVACGERREPARQLIAAWLSKARGKS